MSPGFRRSVASVVVTGGCLLTGCSVGGAERNEPALVIFAAASLAEVFTALAQGFERDHSDIDVQLTFAGSQVLRLQIEQGAAADIFASANGEHMRALVDGGHVAQSQTFATNALTVIVPGRNPAGIERFEQLDRAHRIVVGSPHVPIGRYTEQVLQRAHRALGESFVDSVRRRIVSQESNVRLVRSKIQLGEADAAVVYRTDARAEGIRIVPIPADLNVQAHYPIGRLRRAAQPAAAADFIRFVLSDVGQRTLADHGFRAEVE